MPDEVVEGSVLRPRFDVKVRRVAGSFTVGLADEAFSLSESTAFIWRQVDGRRSVADIAALLSAEYDIDGDTALADTLDVLRVLCALELLRP